MAPEVVAADSTKATLDGVASDASSGGTEAEQANLASWKTVRVTAGDNMSLIFGRLGLSKTSLHELLSLGDAGEDLKRIMPGQEIRFRIERGELIEMIYERDLTRTLHAKRIGQHFRLDVLATEPEIRNAVATTRIDSSLFVAGQKAGLSDQVIMQLIDIFGWDIDFVHDIREGDHYSLIYEEFYKDGEKVKDGRVLAAEFVTQGRALRAVYYLDADGNGNYYSDSGASMRKAFLRTPVNFTRISDHFNLRRRHPILNTIRAHRGVDYAAPHGTPVYATGSGKVVSIGTDGGYGRVIKLQHGGNYTTLYAHLSRFARGLKKGDAVRQGQTIGYVGQTGLATGPHLHYEFHVNGTHRNPLTVELPKAEPIAERFAADFRRKANGLLAQLSAAGNEHADTRVLAAIDPDLLPAFRDEAKRSRRN
jgi:murein DD-endopeptidase MepM/ murein hydrolase activator NlpD